MDRSQPVRTLHEAPSWPVREIYIPIIDSTVFPVIFLEKYVSEKRAVFLNVFNVNVG